MKKYLLVSISMLVFVLSCKKEDLTYLQKYPGLPDATQSGLITAGCLINGKPWVANKDYIFADRAVYAQYGQLSYNIGRDERLFMWFDKVVSKNKDEIAIYDKFIFDITAIKELGIYNPSNTSKFKIEFGQSDYIHNISTSYILDSRVDPYINITKLDTINKIVSGQFDFRVVRKYFTYIDYNDTIRISKGRFDALYSPG